MFFLEAITVQAERNSQKASQVVNLYNEMRSKIVALTKSPHAMEVLDALFISPVLRPANFYKNLRPGTE